MGYRSPDELASIVQRLVPTNAHILDAGAGPGSWGRLSPRRASPDSTASTCPRRCWPRRAKKRIYSDLREARWASSLDYATDSYDAVVSGGVFTAGHAPASRARRARPDHPSGGHVIFTLRSDQRLRRASTRSIAELEQARRWELVERGDEFQALPTGEPEVLVSRLGVSRPGTASSAAARAPPRGSACRRAAASCTRPAGRRARASTRPRSTIRPSFITATSCDDRPDQREVVGDEEEPEAELALQLARAGR